MCVEYSPYILYQLGWWILTNVCRIWVHKFYAARLTDSDKYVPNMDPYIIWRPGWPILTNVFRIWAHRFCITLFDGFWQMCAESGPIHFMSPWLTDSDKESGKIQSMLPWLKDSYKCLPNLGPYIICRPCWSRVTNVCRIWANIYYIALVISFDKFGDFLTDSDKCAPNMSPYILCRPGWRILTNVCWIWAHTYYVALVDGFWQMYAENGPYILCRPGWHGADKYVSNLGPYILCHPGWRWMTNVCRICARTFYAPPPRLTDSDICMPNPGP